MVSVRLGLPHQRKYALPRRLLNTSQINSMNSVAAVVSETAGRYSPDHASVANVMSIPGPITPITIKYRMLFVFLCSGRDCTLKAKRNTASVRRGKRADARRKDMRYANDRPYKISRIACTFNYLAPFNAPKVHEVQQLISRSVEL